MNPGLTKLVVVSLIGLSSIAAGLTQRRSSCCSIVCEPTWSAYEDASVFVQEGGSVLSNGARFTGSRSHQRNQYATLRAYREAIGDQWKATVQILSDSKQLVLGTIVREDGWITTKSSEVPDTPIDVRLHDGTRATGLVKIRRPDLDLALIKIDRDNLSTIRWNTEVEVPVGGWLASADSRSLPMALGVVSVLTRNIRQERPVLGVQLSTQRDEGYVDSVVVGSGAEKAGIREGDIIQQIDGKELSSRREVLDYLMTFPAGSRLNVVVDRDGNRVAMLAQMMDLSSSLLDPTEMEVNGSISARSTGFRNVIQHDTVLAPNDCGGPLIDVDGNCVGLNIARAGRICSYALPARVVAATVEEMLVSVSHPNVGTVANAAGAIEIETLKPAIETLKPAILPPQSGASVPPRGK